MYTAETINERAAPRLLDTSLPMTLATNACIAASVMSSVSSATHGYQRIKSNRLVMLSRKTAL